MGSLSSHEPQRTGDMPISPGSATKILELGKDFAAKQIKLGKLPVADVFDGVPHIGISDLGRISCPRADHWRAERCQSMTLSS